MGVDPTGDNWVKPSYDSLTDAKKSEVKVEMLKAGCRALQDAFWVLQDEHQSNVYNSRTNVVEEFYASNASDYSQSQCAVTIERIFGRLYKYLKFKSTTSEIIQKHINIDSGYKYFTTDALKKSDNPESNKAGNGIYWNDDDTGGPKYLRYLTKLQKYYDDNVPFLTAHERGVLGNFLIVLGKKSAQWLDWHWNLCPLCQTEYKNPASSTPVLRTAKKLASRGVEARAAGEDVDYYQNSIQINMNLNPYMTFASGDISSLPSECSITRTDLDGRPLQISYGSDDEDFELDLSRFVVGNKPRYVDTVTGQTVRYTLAGFATTPTATTPTFATDAKITKFFFPSGSCSLLLYAVWKQEYVVRFVSGEAPDADNLMSPFVLRAGEKRTLSPCSYGGPTETKPYFEYFPSPSVKLDGDTTAHQLWQNVTTSSASTKIYKFSHWEYSFNGVTRVIRDCDTIMIDDIPYDGLPVITFTAKWKLAYDIIPFKILDNTYCKVLIDKTVNKVIYPQKPVILYPKKNFLGWDVMEGDALSGIDRNAKVICGDGASPIICGTDPGPIICDEDGIGEYDGFISAYIGEDLIRSFGVTYKFLELNPAGTAV